MIRAGQFTRGTIDDWRLAARSVLFVIHFYDQFNRYRTLICTIRHTTTGKYG